MRIAIRLDATVAIGLGHLKRCLALAHALHARGALVRFVGRVDSASTSDLISSNGFACDAFPVVSASPHDDSQDALHTVTLLQPWQPDVIVVDHYALSAPWHRAVRSGLRTASGTHPAIVVIDDLADRPLEADLLIDHNPAPDHRAKYNHVLAENVPLCGGHAYALIDAVYAEHAHAVHRVKVQTIGIFMGGTDPHAHTAWVLQVLRQQVGWTGHVIMVTTSANPLWPTLAALASQDGATELWRDLPHLADFHALCDLQLGAGGGAQWERCCLGVPTVALTCAPNQASTVSSLTQAGIVRGLDAIDKTDTQAQALAHLLSRLIESPAERALMRERSLELIDGHGAQRAADAVLSLVTHKDLP
jgi:UDP-2,4-diacetamido-2,4,6-trideoxy-beta-L-altropyranose hydrolase